MDFRNEKLNKELMQMIISSKVWSNAIITDYIETMSKLTGVSENEIERRLQVNSEEERKKLIARLADSGYQE